MDLSPAIWKAIWTGVRGGLQNRSAAVEAAGVFDSHCLPPTLLQHPDVISVFIDTRDNSCLYFGMSDFGHAPAPQDLQFQRAEPLPVEDPNAQRCVVCRSPIGATYFHANGKVVCSDVRGPHSVRAAETAGDVAGAGCPVWRGRSAGGLHPLR